MIHQKIIKSIYSCETVNQLNTCISFIDNERDSIKKRTIANLIELKTIEFRFNAINKYVRVLYK